MSWLYLPESVASNSALRRQAVSELCAVLRKIHTQPKSSRRGCRKGRSKRPRYGTTLPPLTGDLGAALWMSSLAGSRARIYPTQARAQASRKEPAPVYGQRCSESFAMYDPATSLWRTSQLSLVEGLDEFLETWPRAGTTRTGIAYQHEALVPLTGGTGCSLWPTPNAMPGTNDLNWEATDGRMKPNKLGWAVRAWPTPTSRDHKDGSAESCANVPVNALLGRAVHYPTPEPGGSLTQRTWRSPQARDVKNARAPEKWQSGERQPGLNDQVADKTAPDTATRNGQLNPTWVEWLMGFPLGWTDLDVSVTLSYPRWRTGSD